MPKIHLIQKDPDLRPWPSAEGPPKWESGFWDLSEQRARLLIGGDIYFYEHRTEPSFFGGIVEDIKIKEDDPWRERIIFIFKYYPEYRGKRTSREGWGMEMKIEI